MQLLMRLTVEAAIGVHIAGAKRVESLPLRNNAMTGSVTAESQEEGRKRQRTELLKDSDDLIGNYHKHRWP